MLVIAPGRFCNEAHPEQYGLDMNVTELLAKKWTSGLFSTISIANHYALL